MLRLPASYRSALIWTAAALAGGALSWGIAARLPGGEDPPALMAGWGVALANAGTAHWMNRRAVGPHSWAFIRWGIAGNILRMVALLGILLSVIFLCEAGRGSFLTAVFVGFFVFMVVEIVNLTQRDAGNQEMD